MAEAGSVGRAAGRLRRAPSAVSRSIQLLETAIGESLFDRRATGMSPTRVGESLLARGRSAAAEYTALRRDLAAIQGRGAPATSPLYTMAVDNSRLDALIALMEDRHVASAARRLGLTQAAIGASIRALERAIGASLFERGVQGLVPTPTAEALTLRAKRAYAELRHAEADIAAIRGALSGHVAVGALPFGRTIILPRAILKLLAAHPGLRVSTTEGPFDTLTAGLRAGDLDFIFGALRDPPPAPDLETEPVLLDHLSLLGRRGHPLANARKLKPADVARCQWVLPRQGTPARRLFENVFQRRGLAPPEDAVETSSLAMVRALVMESDRVTVLSRHQVHFELADGMLVALPLDLAETQRPIGFMRRAGGTPPPGAALLMQEIRNVGAAAAAAR